MRRIMALAVTCLALICLAACGYNPPASAINSTSSQQAATITVTAQGGASTIREGSTLQFTATSSDSRITSFTWTVNGIGGGNSAIGTIDSTGKYTAPAIGVALANPTNVNITAIAGSAVAGTPLSLQYPVPTVASTDVTQVTVGTGTTVTVTGTNFVNGAQILVGGNAVTTTFVDSAHVKATITASATGTLNITVQNPNPGSATAGTTLALNAVNAGPTISGVAAKNFLSGALITAVPVDNATGAEGAPIGTATTDNSGNFKLQLTTLPSGPVRLKATGGTFVNDVNVSQTVPNTAELDMLLDSVTSNVSGVAITVLTDMVNSITNGYFSGAASMPNEVIHSSAAGTKGNLINSHAAGEVTIKGLYKLNKNPEITPPSNNGSDADGLAVTIISGSMYQCAVNTASAAGVTAGDWIKALSLDFSDGKFDGMYKDSSGATHPVMLKTSTGQIPLSSSAGTTDFLSCMNQFTQAPNTVLTQNNVSTTTITQTTGNIETGVITSPVAPSTGLSSGGSGSVASMTINGKQYLFVAARGSGLVVIDITNPTNPTPPIKVWNTLTNTALGGYQNVGVVVPILGNSTHAQLLAINYYNPHIAIFNAEKLATGTPGTDDAAATDWAGMSDPSGEDTYGALLDVARHGVWLMVSSVGYNFLDLSTNPPKITTKYTIDPGQDNYTENLGGDTAFNYIWGANYSGIQLINLSSGISYDLASTIVNSDPYGWDVDQGLVDTGYHIGFAMDECSSGVGLYDLTKLSFTAPAQGASSGIFSPGTNGYIYKSLYLASPNSYTQCVEVASVDSTSHLAIMTEEWGAQDLYVAKVDNPAAPANGTSWQGFSDWTYFSPSNSTIWTSHGGTFQYGAGDPHSIGTVVAVANGKTYGYILSEDNQHLLAVDMSAFLALPRVGTTGDAAHTVASDPASSSAWWVWTWPGTNSGKHRTGPTPDHRRR